MKPTAKERLRIKLAEMFRFLPSIDPDELARTAADIVVEEWRPKHDAGCPASHVGYCTCERDPIYVQK